MNRALDSRVCIEPLNSIARANWAGLVLIHLLDGAVGLQIMSDQVC